MPETHRAVCDLMDSTVLCVNAGFAAVLVKFRLMIYAVLLKLMLAFCERALEKALQCRQCWSSFGLVLWFAAATITTVGYGDMVPGTVFGCGRPHF